MHKGMIRWAITAGIITIAVAAGWWLSRPEPVAVTLHRVERGTVEITVSNTRAGTVTACRRAKLTPSLGGQIAGLPISEGDRVEQGQLLLELWNLDIAAEAELAMRECQASRATARAACLTAEEAQRDADRQQSLFARQLVSEETRDQALTLARARAAEREAANATSRVSEARVAVVQANLAKTRLIAPFDGVVAEVNGELNEYVTPSPPGIPTLPAVDLIDNTCFYVAAPIDEVDVAGVEVGMTARVMLDAFGDQHFEGKVRRIGAYVVDKEKQARTVDVEVVFSNPGDLKTLLAGYSADVDIILDVRRDVLWLPSEAILDEDRVLVFDAAAGTVAERQVKLGARNWQRSEVLEGLAAGDQVVTNPDTEGLADGVAAKAVTESELP
jgi:HlyD family secretion protein